MLDSVAASQGSAVLRIEWTENAEEGWVVLLGPEELRVPGWFAEPSNPGSYRLELGAVGTGQTTEIELDLALVADGEVIRVAAERHVEDAVFQVASTIRAAVEGAHMAPPNAFRLVTTDVTDSVGPVGRHYASDRTIGRGRSTVTVEALDGKTLETAFTEDNANASIADGPRDCALTVWSWAVSRTIYVSSAPANAIADLVTVHITITHPDMSEIQIGLFDDDGDPRGAVVANRAGGVDLDRDYVYGPSHPLASLVGVGELVNGWFTLVVRDCEGGNVGVLDYWSVTLEYTGGGDTDLVADTVSVSPDPAEPGGDIRVTWEGHVGGSGNVPIDFDVKLYLSQDDNITTADGLLATVNVDSAVNPGDVFGEGAPGRTVTLPVSLPEGTWYVGMMVDPGGEVNEIDEGNNVAWTSLEVAQEAEEVDLVADSLVPVVASVQAGDNLAVDWAGHLAASSTGDVSDAFIVAFYLSPNAAIDASDTLLDQVTITGPLTPGDAFGANGGMLTIPSGTAAGNWFVGMVVDNSGVITETNENNNTRTASLTVTSAEIPQPDVVVRQCSATTAEVAPGDQVVFEWEQRNAGDDKASPFHISILLSDDMHGDPATDTVLVGWMSSTWEAGSAWVAKTRTVDIPAGTADGTWYLMVVLDDTDVLDESNENNNQCSDQVAVESVQPSEATRWLIPAAASSPGLNNSDWRSQVVVNNPSGADREATVFYVVDGAPWPGQLLTGPIQIQANRSLYMDDLLVGLRPTSGLLYVVLDAAGPVVTSRTYNRAADGSTFGQGIPAIALLPAKAESDMVIPMVHSGAGAFRTNLGIVQTSAGNLTVEITIYTAAGTALATSTRVVSDAWEQINDVFAKLGIGAAVVEGGWIRIHRVGGNPDFWTCYGSVVDSVTGDPTYVAGVVP